MSIDLHACVCTMCMQYHYSPEEDNRCPGTGVTTSSCGCWEQNPSPLQEQLWLLTAETSLQTHYQFSLGTAVFDLY